MLLLKDLVNINMISPKKSLGQNFLKDKDICQKIVAALDIEKGDIVLEIGPGTGALTDFLIDYDIDLTLIEIDSRSIEYLKKRYSESKNYKIIQESFLEINLNDFFQNDKKIKIIGNIPYYISGRIFYTLFENSAIISKSVLTVQKEVALRVASLSGKKDYGILSVAAAYSGKAEKLFDIPASAFIPPPKVTSASVKLEFNPKLEISKFREVMKLVKVAFNQRRKMLSNSLKSHLNEANMDFLENDELWKQLKNKRPEQITPDQYVILFEIIKNNANK